MRLAEIARLVVCAAFHRMDYHRSMPMAPHSPYVQAAQRYCFCARCGRQWYEAGRLR